MNITLSASPPFSLPAVAKSHGWFQLAPFGWDDDAQTLTCVLQPDRGTVVSVRVRESPAAPGVVVETDQPLSRAARDAIADQVTWMLALKQDFSEFYVLAREEPKLAHMPERARGRLLRSPTLFEDTVKTILTTNTSWAGTIRMAAALVGNFGAPLPDEPDRRAFPTPGQLAAASEDQLRERASLGYRAPYVLALARAVDSSALELESLRTTDMPTPELRDRLLSIKGVGAYAAANLLMLLGRYDRIPVDSWALKVVSHEWHEGEPIGSQEVEAAFAHWGDWKGLAFWFWDWDYLAQ